MGEASTLEALCRISQSIKIANGKDDIYYERSQSLANGRITNTAQIGLPYFYYGRNLFMRLRLTQMEQSHGSRALVIQHHKTEKMTVKAPLITIISPNA
jgi:hypothetical protein